MDYVADFISLKEQYKEIEEKLKALELVILNDYRDDDRIKIVAPRKTITIKDETYEKLETAGIETTVTEVRKKKFEEFDIDVQNILNGNEKNFDIKYSKESIRVK
jgi:hypothetical protein